jgi:predicted permease
VRSVAGNPLILASLAGIAARAVVLPLGPFEDALGLLGQASLGTGLLSVGATLRFRGVAAQLRPIAGASVLKLVALPLATWAIARALQLAPDQVGPLLVFQALPTASAAFVLARAMGGDERLMASILAVQTLLALGWLPVAFTVARALS